MWNVSFVCVKSIHTAAKLNEVPLMSHFKASLVQETLLCEVFSQYKAHDKGVFGVKMTVITTENNLAYDI